MKTNSKILFIFILAITIAGCGFENLIFYKRAEEDLRRHASWRAAEEEKLKAQVAPYMGTYCRDNIELMFGEPEDKTIYPSGSKVSYDADEVWHYPIYQNKRRIGSRIFFFREGTLIAVAVH